MGQVSQPETTLSIQDVSTGQTVTVTLEDGGMETVNTRTNLMCTKD